MIEGFNPDDWDMDQVFPGPSTNNPIPPVSNNGIIARQWNMMYPMMPNAFLRSALFGIVAGRKREFIRDQIIASQSNYAIGYSGLRLDQKDFDVFHHAIRISAKSGMIGVEHVCSFRAFLKRMQKTPNGSNQRVLWESLKRLCAANVTVEYEGQTYCSNLLHEVSKKQDTGELSFVVNPKLGHLFMMDMTSIDPLKRIGMKGQLQRWLFNFYSTHEQSIPLPVKYLHRLCGAQQELREFRRQLKSAMRQLCDVKPSLFYCWKITYNDRLEVTLTREMKPYK